MSGVMQEGIFYKEGTRPGKFFLIAFLAVEPNANASQVKRCLGSLWQKLKDLKLGVVEDLPGYPVPPSDLNVTIGYGPLAFKVSGTMAMPSELGPSNRFLSPRTSGGGLLLNGAGLFYEEQLVKNMATEAIAIQLIAETQLAVQRALVEMWKTLTDYPAKNGEPATLYLVSHFQGFQREDHRSWIDFHDGISNLRSGTERENAITIKDSLFQGGTYLCFMRLLVDLPHWRKLSRTEQEIVVGRDKLTGCSLIGIDANGTALREVGCPFVGSSNVIDSGNDAFHEPPLVGHPRLRQSHVQRANLQHNQSMSDPQSLRIFRQGYEFLESSLGTPPFRVGLNFVSFQDTPRRVIRLLTRDGWLGNTNFGGTPIGENAAVDLLRVNAAGIYLIPPIASGENFPGEVIFQ
jgi:deferrochelatase/peroxidase EfeB